MHIPVCSFKIPKSLSCGINVGLNRLSTTISYSFSLTVSCYNVISAKCDI